jgi:toxin ParE1/3/4
VRVRLTARARLDLVEIGTHIAAENPARAEAFVGEIEERCRSLAETPERGKRLGGRRTSLRRLQHGSYLIVYAVRPEIVMIERVLHGARDLSALLDEFD